MQDYQRIADDVHSALFNNGQDGDDVLQAIAAEYGLTIDEVNGRLRQCGALLRKGLRSEAIQLCEVEPNLLDVVQTVDFSERPSWNELLRLHGLAVPAALMLDVAADLNEAYALEQPLAALLQRHRLLAMSHGPVKLRLETLRNLADADPDNPVWDQDVRTFEEERVKELQQEVPQTIAGGNMTALNALANDLEHSAWRIDRPDALIQQITATISNAVQLQGIGELLWTADDLNAMHLAFDVDGGRRARAQWDTLFATWGKFADPSLPQGVAAAQDWLREQDELAQQAARYASAVADMEQAIMARSPAKELHRLHCEVTQVGEMPESLETSYRERLDAIDRARRRRIRLSRAIFAVFIVTVGSVIAVKVLQHLHAGKVVRALASLQQLVEENNIDEARNFIDQLTIDSPKIAADPQIEEINEFVTNKIEEENRRRLRLATQLDIVQKVIDEKFSNDEADDALVEAKKLAKTEEENTTIRKAEQDIAKLRKTVQLKLELLQKMVSEKSFDEAKNFIDQLAADSPKFFSDPRIRKINRLVTNKIEEEKRRRLLLAMKLNFVQKVIDDKIPNDDTDDALAEAKKLAKTEEENTKIHKAEQDIAKLRKAVQLKVDQDFLAQLKELKVRVDAIEKDIEEKPDACNEKLNRLTIEFTKLQESNPQITDAARIPAGLLWTRLKAMGEEAHTASNQLSGEEMITAACGDNAVFRQMLIEYADKFPQARRSGSFRTVTGDEAFLWDWIVQWNETVQSIGRRNPTKFNRKTAAGLADKLRKLLDDRPGHPDADAFKLRLSYMDAIVRRIDGEGNPIEAPLKSIFTNPLVAEVWMLKTTSNQTHYLLQDPTAKWVPQNNPKPEAWYGQDCVIGFDLSKKGISFQGKNIIASSFIAPQRATAKALLGILEEMTDEQWEPSFCRMIETVLNDNDTDPLLKHFFLRKILAVGCQGSLCLQKGFDRPLELLKNSKVSLTVNWVNPNDPEGVEQRPFAKDELSKLPKFTDAQNSTAKEWKSLGEAIGTKLICVGWLRKNMAGNWQCLTKSGCAESGKLVIVRTDGQNQKAAIFSSVGRLDKGKVVLDAVPWPVLAEGRPVYITNSPPPK